MENDTMFSVVTSISPYFVLNLTAEGKMVPVNTLPSCIVMQSVVEAYEMLLMENKVDKKIETAIDRKCPVL